MNAEVGKRSGPAQQGFGAFTLDHDRAQLSRDGRLVTLRPKTFALLAYLADRAGHVVPKQELLDALWPGLVVTDDSLTQAVSELRRVLGDREQKLIRTASRRGYIFVAAVLASVPDERDEALPPGSPAAPPADRPHPRLARSILTTVGLVIVALLLFGLTQMRTAPSRIDAELSQRRSIAVMPFTDMSDPKVPHVAYAVDHDLTTDLGRLGDIKVISRESSAVLGTSADVDAKRAGRELDVRHVLTGSVRREGERLAVTVHLIRTDTGALLWSDRFDYPSVSDWVGRRDISARVASLLETKLQKSVLDQAVRRPLSNQAVDHWMRGSYLLDKLATREQLVQARTHFEAALAAQPDSVHALAGLAATHVCEVLYRWSKDPAASLSLAKTLAQRALDIDPYDQTALKMLTGAYQFSGAIDDAMSTTRRQLELNPNDAHSNRDLAANLAWLGRWEEALQQVDVAQRLNPLDHSHIWKCHSIRARVLIVLHRYDEAIEQARLAAAADATIVGPYLHLASAEAHRGNLAAARQHAAEVMRREPGFTMVKLVENVPSKVPEYLAGSEHYYRGLRLAGLPEGSLPNAASTR